MERPESRPITARSHVACLGMGARLECARVTRSKEIHDHQTCPETHGASRGEVEVEVRALAHPVRNHRASGAARRVHWTRARAARIEDGRGAFAARFQRFSSRFADHPPPHNYPPYILTP